MARKPTTTSRKPTRTTQTGPAKKVDAVQAAADEILARLRAANSNNAASPAPKPPRRAPSAPPTPAPKPWHDGLSAGGAAILGAFGGAAILLLVAWAIGSLPVQLPQSQQGAPSAQQASVPPPPAVPQTGPLPPMQVAPAPYSPYANPEKQARILANCIAQAKLRRERLGEPADVTWDSPFKCRVRGGFTQTGALTPN